MAAPRRALARLGRHTRLGDGSASKMKEKEREKRKWANESSSHPDEIDLGPSAAAAAATAAAVPTAQPANKKNCVEGRDIVSSPLTRVVPLY